MCNEKLSKDRNGVVTCDKKNLHFSPRLGDRNYTTRWIKIIYNHKPWEIFYILHILHVYQINNVRFSSI